MAGVRSPKWGYAFAIAAALFWAVSGSSAKYLFNSGVSPFQLVQLRLTLAFFCLGGFLLIFRPHLLKIDRKDLLYFVIFGVVGMAGVQFTYLFAISRIKVAAAILLQYLAPSMIAVYFVVFAKERLSRATVFALGCALAGCWLVVGAYNLNILSMNLAGIVSGVLSAVTFAWYSLHGEYGMRKYNPWTVLFYAFAFGALAWNIAHPPFEGLMHAWRPAQWFWIFYIAVFGTLVPFGLYLEGINLIRSTRASITATLEPITAGVLSYLFLGEVMEPLQLLGGALVITAIVILQVKQERDENAPGLIRAQREGAGNSR